MLAVLRSSTSTEKNPNSDYIQDLFFTLSIKTNIGEDLISEFVFDEIIVFVYIQNYTSPSICFSILKIIVTCV